MLRLFIGFFTLAGIIAGVVVVVSEMNSDYWQTMSSLQDAPPASGAGTVNTPAETSAPVLSEPDKTAAPEKQAGGDTAGKDTPETPAAKAGETPEAKPEETKQEDAAGDAMTKPGAVASLRPPIVEDGPEDAADKSESEDIPDAAADDAGDDATSAEEKTAPQVTAAIPAPPTITGPTAVPAAAERSLTPYVTLNRSITRVVGNPGNIVDGDPSTEIWFSRVHLGKNLSIGFGSGEFVDFHSMTYKQPHASVKNMLKKVEISVGNSITGQWDGVQVIDLPTSRDPMKIDLSGLKGDIFRLAFFDNHGGRNIVIGDIDLDVSRMTGPMGASEQTRLQTPDTAAR